MSEITLADIKDGESVTVVEMTDEKVMVEGLRSGIVEGSKIEVTKKVSSIENTIIGCF